MKTAGALTIIVGVLAGLVLLLLPAEITVLGTSASCGPPVVGLVAAAPADDSISAALVRDCKSRSVVRCFLGVVVFAIATGGGAIMLVVSGKTPRAQPQWWWDGYRWVRRP